VTLSTTATTIEADGGLIECSIVPWDSEIFEFPVAAISKLELGEDAEGRALLGGFDAWCADHAVRLASCRIDHLRLRESMALEAHGFRFVEMVFGQRLERFESIDTPRHQISVDEATPADLEAIERVAYAAFTTGRYLLDWRLPPDLSNRRYARWVRNSLDAPAQTILKAEIDGRLAGFFIVERHPDRSVYWHLTAIAPAFQGQGIGRSVWQTILLRHAAEGVARVDTTVSAHNPAVLNLYARLGFSVQPPMMTFHWLRNPPA
jgi:ribosomal protein S18 acetylase RimI-like enzyme